MDGIAEIQRHRWQYSKVSVMLKFTVPEKEITQHWDVMRRKIAAAKTSDKRHGTDGNGRHRRCLRYVLRHDWRRFLVRRIEQIRQLIKRELLILTA